MSKIHKIKTGKNCIIKKTNYRSKHLGVLPEIFDKPKRALRFLQEFDTRKMGAKTSSCGNQPALLTPIKIIPALKFSRSFVGNIGNYTNCLGTPSRCAHFPCKSLFNSKKSVNCCFYNFLYSNSSAPLCHYFLMAF